MQFVKKPYLPEGRVCLGVGDVAVEGVRVIKPYKSPSLPPTLALHADLSFCYIGGGVAVCSPESEAYYKAAFEAVPLKIVPGGRNPDKHYPADAAYNIAIVGERVFCRVDICDEVLLSEVKRAGYEIFDMKQGYGKCSVCPVDSFSAISGDASFEKAARKAGLEVLRVENSPIALPGYENGFFGGCAFMTDKATLYVKGDLTSHPDFEKIRRFTAERGITISCSEGKLTDFGSFVPVMEE